MCVATPAARARRVFGWALRGKRANNYKQLLTSDGSYTVLAAFDLGMGYVAHHTHENRKGDNFGADAFVDGFTREIVRGPPSPRAVPSPCCPAALSGSVVCPRRASRSFQCATPTPARAL